MQIYQNGANLRNMQIFANLKSCEKGLFNQFWASHQTDIFLFVKFVAGLHSYRFYTNYAIISMYVLYSTRYLF